MTASIHGSLIALSNHGILITGPPGSGKSTLALGLIDRGHQLVADDSPDLLIRDGRLFGLAPASPYQYQLHIHRIGLVDVPTLYGPKAVKDEAIIELFINLDTSPQPLKDDELLHGRWSETHIHHTDIPTLHLPASTGTSLPLLVETAARKRLNIQTPN